MFDRGWSLNTLSCSLGMVGISLYDFETNYIFYLRLMEVYINTISITFTGDAEILGTVIQDMANEIISLLESQIDAVVVTLRQKLCITEREEAEIAKSESDDQKICYLLVLIRGRSFPVLMKFLDTIKEFCKEEGESLTTSIYKIFDRNRQKNLVQYKCGYCNIQEYIKLRDLATYLWQRRQIMSKLYKDIVDPRNNKLKEKDLWNSLFYECNTMTHIAYIQEYLQKENLYTHLADEIWEQAKLQNFMIRCGCSNKRLKKRFLSPQASRKSLDAISTQANSDNDIWISTNHTTDTRTTHKKRAMGLRHLTCCVRKDKTATKDDSYSLYSMFTTPD